MFVALKSRLKISTFQAVRVGTKVKIKNKILIEKAIREDVQWVQDLFTFFFFSCCFFLRFFTCPISITAPTIDRITATGTPIAIPTVCARLACARGAGVGGGCETEQ